MKTSEQIHELALALSKAQAEIRGAEKDSTNPHFGKAYASLASVWDACRGPLTKNGLSVVQAIEDSAHGMILYTRLMHATGQFIESSYAVRPQQNTPQGVGSALTYARRYSLGALVGVAAAEEDDDANEAMKKPKGRSENATNNYSRHNAPASFTSPQARPTQPEPNPLEAFSGWTGEEPPASGGGPVSGAAPRWTPPPDSAVLGAGPACPTCQGPTAPSRFPDKKTGLRPFYCKACKTAISGGVT